MRSALPPCEGRCAAQPRIEHIVNGGGACSAAQRAAPCSCVNIPRTESRRHAQPSWRRTTAEHLIIHRVSGAFAHAACPMAPSQPRPPLWRTGQAWPLKTAGWSAGLNGEAAAGNLASTPRASPHQMRVNPCARMVGAQFSDRLPDHCPILQLARPSLHRVSVGALTRTRATVVSRAKRCLADESRVGVSRVLSGWRHGGDISAVVWGMLSTERA